MVLNMIDKTICPTCNKPARVFIKNQCKICYEKARRILHADIYATQKLILKINRYNKKHELINFLGGKICKHCGVNTLPDCCYDFHHIDNKKELISTMLNNDDCIELIKKEVVNCILLCANCHRQHHWDIQLGASAEKEYLNFYPQDKENELKK